MIYIGIDPGLDGALAVLGCAGCARATPMLIDAPTSVITKGKKNRRAYDVSAMAAHLSLHRGVATLVALDAVHAMPGQGVTSMFSMRYGFGFWRGSIAACQFPC